MRFFLSLSQKKSTKMKQVMIIALLLAGAWAMTACTYENGVQASTQPPSNVEATDKTSAEELPNESLPKTTINWADESHDFGQIAQNEPVTHIFTLTNSGNEPLIIESVKPACGCTVADYSKEPIAPGKTGEVKAEFNAKKVGKFTKTLTVTANTEPRVQRLTFKGEVLEGE